jgi:hypothetical protein
MDATPEHDMRLATMTITKVYPMYVAKVVKKGRTEAELEQVIHWLTGFDRAALEAQIAANASFDTFFAAAKLHPNAHQITGLICGYRVEEMTNPLSQKVRYLDKLVDELAKGRKMDKILRAG